MLERMKRPLLFAVMLGALGLVFASAFTADEETSVKRGDVLTGGGGLTKVITSGASIAGDGRTATPLHLLSNAGDPNGVVTAAKGTILLDTSTPAFYQNTTGGTAWQAIGTLSAGTVTRAQLVNGAATSVIGRSANSIGVEADVAASADSQVLQRAAGVLTWATLAAASLPAFTGDVTTSAGTAATTIAANAVTDGKLRQGGATSVIGRGANSTGNVADIAASADGQVLYRSSGALAFADLGTNVPYLGVFGDGSDGSLTFDGSTAVLGVTPASNVYTMTRDIFATNVTINTGVTVVLANTDTVVTNTNGNQAYRLFLTGTLTLTGTAKIRNTGGAGAPTTAGGGAAGQLGTSATGGHAGGAGGAAGAGSAGVNGVSHHTTAAAVAGGAGVGGTGNTGGGGAAGGHGSAGNGGGGASLTTAAVGLGGLRDFRAFTTGKGLDGNSWHFGGAGGGGGGGATSQSGGGGGGGGGVICVLARLGATGSGTIEARGGAGGTAQAAGNGGGGGGGGGGTIIFIHGSGSIPTTDASGGAAGLHLGTGSDGGVGGAGTVFDVKL